MAFDGSGARGVESLRIDRPLRTDAAHRRLSRAHPVEDLEQTQNLPVVKQLPAGDSLLQDRQSRVYPHLPADDLPCDVVPMSPPLLVATPVEPALPNALLDRLQDPLPPPHPDQVLEDLPLRGPRIRLNNPPDRNNIQRQPPHRLRQTFSPPRARNQGLGALWRSRIPMAGVNGPTSPLQAVYVKQRQLFTVLSQPAGRRHHRRVPMDSWHSGCR